MGAAPTPHHSGRAVEAEEEEEEEGEEVFSVQQVPRRRSPQQIAVIQPRSIWQRAVRSRGSRCHAAALPRRPGAPGNGSCPARICSAVPGEDGAPQLPFPEPPLASVSLVLSWCDSWGHGRVTSLLSGSSLELLSQPSRASHTRPEHPSARWEGLCPLWGHTWLCFHGGTAPWAEATRSQWPPATIGVRAASSGHL